MSHIAPIELRLHLGLAAPVTAEEVGELLGIGDDERDRLLERVPPLARGPRGGLRYPEGEGGKQRTRGLGRVVTAEVEAVAHAAVSELGSVKLPTRGEVTTWSILLRAALVAWRADAVAGDLADASIEVYEGAVARVLGVAEAWPLPEGPRALDAQVTALRDALLVAGWAPATARTALTVACKAWGWGVRQEVIAPVPWPRVRLRVEPRDGYRPTTSDVQKILAGLRAPRPVHRGAQVEHGWPAVAVLLWWATGARIGEIGALRVGDLRLDASAAVLLGRHRGARKTGSRWVDLDETVAAAVAAYLEARGPLGVTDPLWPVRAEYVRSSLWREHVRPILVREGIPDFTAHAGRAAVIDTLYELGEDPRLVADLLGHSVATAIAYYRRSRPPRQRAAMLARGVGATTTAPETLDNVVPLRSRP